MAGADYTQTKVCTNATNNITTTTHKTIVHDDLSRQSHHNSLRLLTHAGHAATLPGPTPQMVSLTSDVFWSMSADEVQVAQSAPPGVFLIT